MESEPSTSSRSSGNLEVQPNTTSAPSTHSEVQIFNDPVHGSIELHPLLVKIIHTPQFQRLKDIKQLGVCYWIFPGASHNRFEHCLGTSYLCGKMIDTLHKLHRDEIVITDNESLCIKIAGLCRDLGYGPFWHRFHNVYKPSVSGASENYQQSKQSQKEASCKLFDFMLEQNDDLRKAFDESEILEPGAKDFIKDLIRGKELEDVTRCCKYKNGNYKKSFLYEIVSNKRNRIDCNKFDYLARDCHNVGVKSNFDCQRYFQTIRIMPVDDRLQICVRDKEVLNLYELFHTRWSLYHQVYNHKTKAPIEDMLAEALLKVDDRLKITNSINDMSHYSKLTDSIVYDILRKEDEFVQAKKLLASLDNDLTLSEELIEMKQRRREEILESETKLKEAQKLLMKIQRRELYKCCGEVPLNPPKYKYPFENKEDEQGHQRPSDKVIAEEIASVSEKEGLKHRIFVSIIYVHFGKEEEDPINHVEFFNKSLQTRKITNKDQVSHMLPKTFHERYLRVYAKCRDETEEVQRCFKEWCIPYRFLPLLNDDQSGGIQE